MGFYDPAETLAYCAGNCQASRYPPSTCRCPCLGRNHGILRNRIIDVTGYRESYPSDRVISLLPEARLQLMAQNLGHDLDRNLSIEGLAAPALRDGPIQIDRDNVGRPSLKFSDGKARIVKKIGKKLFGLRPSESELNEQIYKGLRVQFNEANTDLAIDQACSVFYSHDPNMPRPELYELYETGLIDKALELMGKRWVIGRPRK